MRELTLIVTDLYLAPELRESLVDSMVPDASLPTLELLLARAGERRSSDWRSLICEMVQVPTAGPAPVAAVARLSAERGTSGRATSDQWWIASPVHLTATMDHVQLSEVLTLGQDEWRQIVSGFNEEFGADAGVLELQGGAQAFWRPAEVLDARTVDPARIAGGDMHDALPDGTDGARLRQLMTEVQMWLHEHPLNRERERGGLPTVNGLWFWGGGVLPAWSSATELPVLIGNDPFASGLWTLLGGRREPLPAALPVAAVDSSRGVVVTLALRDLPGAGWLERLRAFEAAWLAPAARALRAGVINRLGLQINDVVFVVRRSDMRRFWRRPRPWLEAFA